MTKVLKNGEYEYREKDFVGEGAFAKVYKGIITKTDNNVLNSFPEDTTLATITSNGENSE